jgi:hypothetical protein
VSTSCVLNIRARHATPDDRIWEVFNANETIQQLWNLKQIALAEQDLKIDIVYESPDFPYADEYQYINRLDEQK